MIVHKVYKARHNDSKELQIRNFKMQNKTGVDVTVHSPDSGEEVASLTKGSGPEDLLDCAGWAVVLIFSQTKERVEVELDHSHWRAYILEPSGRRIFIEPVNEVSSAGCCTLNIHSAVRIYNRTVIPFRISCELIDSSWLVDQVKERVGE